MRCEEQRAGKHEGMDRVGQHGGCRQRRRRRGEQPHGREEARARMRQEERIHWRSEEEVGQLGKRPILEEADVPVGSLDVCVDRRRETATPRRESRRVWRTRRPVRTAEREVCRVRAQDRAGRWLTRGFCQCSEGKAGQMSRAHQAKSFVEGLHDETPNDEACQKNAVRAKATRESEKKCCSPPLPPSTRKHPCTI
jgi:hypothetical protein